jgi:ABC-2 type transport system ATP-binding protein
LQLWEYVKKINQEQGVTVIITTHYLVEAQELCDNIAFINDGKIIKQDSKKKLLEDLGSRYFDIRYFNESLLPTQTLRTH